jgi:hypothetical protein
MKLPKELALIVSDLCGKTRYLCLKVFDMLLQAFRRSGDDELVVGMVNIFQKQLIHLPNGSHYRLAREVKILILDVRFLESLGNVFDDSHEPLGVDIHCLVESCDLFSRYSSIKKGKPIYPKPR